MKKIILAAIILIFPSLHMLAQITPQQQERIIKPVFILGDVVFAVQLLEDVEITGS